MDITFERRRRIKDETYHIFRGGVRVQSADLCAHYKRGQISLDKPTWSQPAALGAWLAGQDDAKDGIEDSY